MFFVSRTRDIPWSGASFHAKTNFFPLCMAEETAVSENTDRRPRSDGRRREGDASNQPRRDGPRKDGPRRDGPRRDGPRRDRPRRDGPQVEGGQRRFDGPSARQGEYFSTFNGE
jgi:hypothetical protein